MKKIFLLATLSVSLGVFAHSKVQEFDPTEEAKCYKEVKALGCVNKEGEEQLDCVDKKMAQLTKACQSMHKEKKDAL
jgi:hypothetical protein